MRCCVDCFKDAHIRDIINAHGVIGDCDYCSQKQVAVYDISVTPNPISDQIDALIQLYVVSNIPGSRLLKAALHDDWDVFNAGAATIQTLVQELCPSVASKNPDVFTEQVIIPELLDKDFLNEYCVVRGFSWEKFADSIKYENRFHSNMFNADAFASFLSIIAKQYPAGSEFYRARVAHSGSGFSKDEMRAPPKGFRSAGRINPEGIGVLYLSSDDRTVLNEIRANTFDYVSIGKFKSNADIKVVNLSGISAVSPFSYQDDLEKYAANRGVFQEIAVDVAKPLRRSDSPIEYLPTQYIAGFIKSQNYDGVEYASTLKEGGYNIAIFDETLFECVDVRTLEVTKIQYETR